MGIFFFQKKLKSIWVVDVKTKNVGVGLFFFFKKKGKNRVFLCVFFYKKGKHGSFNICKRNGKMGRVF
jgi:mRNA deadenylase 3'-5' endonuclease subunit Ccr4